MIKNMKIMKKMRRPSMITSMMKIMMIMKKMSRPSMSMMKIMKKMR